MITLNLDGQKFDHVSNGALANNRLTAKPLVIILSKLSTHWAVRICSRVSQEMPIARLILSLRCQKLKFLVWRCLGRESVRGSLALSANPNNVTPPDFLQDQAVSPHIQESHTMPQSKTTQQTNNQAQIEQNQ